MISTSRYRRAATVAILGLVFGNAGPAAAKPSNLRVANTGPCSEVCSGGGYAAPRTTYTGPSSEVIENGGYGSPSVNQTASSGTQHGISGGFDWAYLAIGGGIAGLAVLGVGVMYATSHRRDQRESPQRSTIAT
jgi:hypothetical protein